MPIFEWLPRTTKKTLWADLVAGLTGAVIVLPQGIAFALIAGLPPEVGLYTAMIGPVIAAFFQSSYHIISGPTTAISIVVFGILSQVAEPMSMQFVEYAVILTFLAGAFQLLLGALRLGVLVNFVSHAVIIGFTAGAAVLIAAKQLKNVLGIPVPRGITFYEIMQFIGLHLAGINYYALTVGLGTLISALFFKRFIPKLPYMLLAMIFGSLLNIWIDGTAHGVQLIDKIEAIFPEFHAPELNFENIRLLSAGAVTVGFLSLIQSISIARAIAVHSHQRIDANQEFIGQGITHMVSSFFRCYVGAGSFTRSGVNFQAGAKSPLSGIFASSFLLAILLFIAPWTAYLPTPAMGGIIVLVGYNLIDFVHIKKIIHASKYETAVMIVTFVTTLLFRQLDYAIYIGVLLALIFYLMYTSTPRIVLLGKDLKNKTDGYSNVKLYNLKEHPLYRIARIDGSIYFGAVDHIAEKLFDLSLQDAPNYLILDLKGVNFVDVSGVEFLLHERKRWQELGGDLFICNLKKPVRDFFKKGGFAEEFGMSNIFKDRSDALQYVENLLNPSSA